MRPCDFSRDGSLYHGNAIASELIRLMNMGRKIEDWTNNINGARLLLQPGVVMTKHRLIVPSFSGGFNHGETWTQKSNILTSYSFAFYSPVDVLPVFNIKLRVQSHQKSAMPEVYTLPPSVLWLQICKSGIFGVL